LLTQTANQPIARPQLNGQDNLLKFKPSIRIRINGDLSDSERGMVVGAGRAETADLLGFSPKTSQGFTENGPKKSKNPVSGSCVNEKALLM